jgi:hypothetical protein
MPPTAWISRQYRRPLRKVWNGQNDLASETSTLHGSPMKISPDASIATSYDLETLSRR